MKKYITKVFFISPNEIDATEDVDKWLNSFNRNLPTSEYNYMIVGWACPDKNHIVITVEVIESNLK